MSNVDVVKTDILIVGGGPAGLATSIRLADLLKEKGLQKRILLIDKGSSIGSHIISGAVLKPEVFKELLPEVDRSEIPLDAAVKEDRIFFLSEKKAFRLPFHPPYMGNKANYTASLSAICRFLAQKAEEKGVEIYSGFSVSELLYDNSGKVSGAKTIDTGIDHHGKRMENFQAGTHIEASLTILAEGSRGSLSKELINKFKLQQGRNPQLYSLGCKELWKVPEGNIAPGEVYHTMGYPLNTREFGGGFIYGLSENRVVVGLVVGLDYPDPTFDTHNAFQIWKTHPQVRRFLQGGQLLEYGAKTLPEGGFYSLPKLYTDHALLVGDSAGFLAMPALKGIHLAIHSGMAAAETALLALEQNNFSESMLQHYEKLVYDPQGRIYKELYPVRNFRQGFTRGLFAGAFHFATQLISGGAGCCGKLSAHSDSEATQKLKDFKGKTFKERFGEKPEFDKVICFDKVTDVYYSGVNHDEEQPAHLHVNSPETFNAINIHEYGAPCQYYCSAEVYEIHTDKNGNKELRIHAENCLHCKTCDIKEPAGGITWKLPNGGNGPEYKYM